MRTRLILCSTLFQLISTAAMKDAGVFGTDRCVLILTNTSANPELVPGVAEAPGVREALLQTFDTVISLDEWIAPFHPREWRVAPANGPMLERMFRSIWGLGDEPLELITESLPNAPGGALATALPSALVSMHSDGLMSYGPVRRALPAQVAQRFEAIYYVDLIPGLIPTRLDDYAPRHIAAPAASLRDVFSRLAEVTMTTVPNISSLAGLTETALLLGQYLTAIGILTPAEELALHMDMVDAAMERGISDIVFKPHPSAPPADIHDLRAHARARGAQLTVITAPVSAEALFATMNPAVVISCFSTAMTTASAVYGLPAAAVGTDLVLPRLVPYQNSNRIPVALIDAVFRQGLPAPADTESPAPADDLQGLLNALSYTLQPHFYDYWRDETADYLRAVDGTALMRYFSPGRLRRLGLPGAPPTTPSSRLVQLAKRPAKAVLSPASRRRLRSLVKRH